LLQAPQFFGSESRFEQTPLHFCRGPVQVQAPLKQASSPTQVVPHVLQFFLSLLVSTHEPPQLVRPPLHALEQAPLWQTWAAVHARAQTPQFSWLIARSTQAPLHLVWPVGQVVGPMSAVQRPSMQIMSSGQGRSPWFPQKRGSVRAHPSIPIATAAKSGKQRVRIFMVGGARPRRLSRGPECRGNPRRDRTTGRVYYGGESAV
jgi:hypothetical protein